MPSSGVPVWPPGLWTAIPPGNYAGNDRRLVRAAGELRRCGCAHGSHRSLFARSARNIAKDSEIMAKFVLIACCAFTLSAQSLQKFRTFYPGDAAEVPERLGDGQKMAIASDGARWTAAARGLYRDRTEYFAG